MLLRDQGTLKLNLRGLECGLKRLRGLSKSMSLLGVDMGSVSGLQRFRDIDSQEESKALGLFG